MGLFSADIKTMDDLYVHQLQDIYYAEKQILKSLPDMIGKSTDRDLKTGLQKHLQETENHVARLEQVFKLHDLKPKAVDCPAIDGIIDEAEEVSGEVEDKEVLDAAIIASAQAVEHYEITRYGMPLRSCRRRSTRRRPPTRSCPVSPRARSIAKPRVDRNQVRNIARTPT